MVALLFKALLKVLYYAAGTGSAGRCDRREDQNCGTKEAVRRDQRKTDGAEIENGDVRSVQSVRRRRFYIYAFIFSHDSDH